MQDPGHRTRGEEVVDDWTAELLQTYGGSVSALMPAPMSAPTQSSQQTGTKAEGHNNNNTNDDDDTKEGEKVIKSEESEHHSVGRELLRSEAWKDVLLGALQDDDEFASYAPSQLRGHPVPPMGASMRSPRQVASDALASGGEVQIGALDEEDISAIGAARAGARLANSVLRNSPINPIVGAYIMDGSGPGGITEISSLEQGEEEKDEEETKEEEEEEGEEVEENGEPAPVTHCENEKTPQNDRKEVSREAHLFHAKTPMRPMADQPPSVPNSAFSTSFAFSCSSTYGREEDFHGHNQEFDGQDYSFHSGQRGQGQGHRKSKGYGKWSSMGEDLANNFETETIEPIETSREDDTETFIRKTLEKARRESLTPKKIEMAEEEVKVIVAERGERGVRVERVERVEEEPSSSSSSSSSTSSTSSSSEGEDDDADDGSTGGLNRSAESVESAEEVQYNRHSDEGEEKEKESESISHKGCVEPDQDNGLNKEKEEKDEDGEKKKQTYSNDTNYSNSNNSSSQESNANDSNANESSSSSSDVPPPVHVDFLTGMHNLFDEIDKDHSGTINVRVGLY